MSRLKLSGIIASLFALALLCSPAVAGDCSFNLPCSESIQVQGPALSIEGTGINGVGIQGSGGLIGVAGITGSMTWPGVYGSGPKFGVEGSAFGDTGAGVSGNSSGNSYGVQGKSTKKTGVYGEGVIYGVHG